MHSKATITLVFSAWLLLAIPVFAQKTELAVTAGGYFPVNSPYHADNAFAIGGSLAQRIVHVPLVSLYAEVPVFATFDSTANITGTTLLNPKYSALFVAPGLKLKLAPIFPISPYFVVGGGLAHFSKSNVSTNTSTNTGVFDVGGGLDFKLAPYIGARTEIRDFYSGSPDLVTNFSQRQHQIVASAGLVLRF